MVSLGLSVLLVGASSSIERDSGVLWIAPELVERAARVVHPTLLTATEVLAVDPRMVKFEWNAATGELSYSTRRQSEVTRLEDLVRPSPEADPSKLKSR